LKIIIDAGDGRGKKKDRLKRVSSEFRMGEKEEK